MLHYWGLLYLGVSLALTIDVNDRNSICGAAAKVVDGMLNYYEGTRYGGTVGMFQAPYYWWQAGEAFGGLVDFWYYCENSSYADLLYDALIAQTGEDFDYIPSNQSTTEGNDDQGLWGITVMGAAERNFTPPADHVPDWLALTQAVYNTMWNRWDTEHCGGGLRWQIFAWNSGYDYKNTISTGCLFHIAARLARFTGNETYADVAEEVYDWLTSVEFVVEGNETTRVYDGSEIHQNCTKVNALEWSYNIGIILGGAAYMYNFTEDEVWFQRTCKLLKGSFGFFNDSVMYERACLEAGTCNNDQRSFRSIFSRSLGLTSIMVPELYDIIRPCLEASALAAAQSCSGGYDGHTCGMDWGVQGWDGQYGLGEQMSSLEILQSLLVTTRPAPYTSEDPNVAVGDVSAGLESESDELSQKLQLNQRDHQGAAVITALICASLVICGIWLVL